MTAQIPDTFLYEGEPYSLIGINGSGLVEPEQFGMQAVMMHTACYSGFYATYEISAGTLYLKELTLNEANDHYIPIEGIEPVLENYCHTYRGLHVLAPFTGRIRLGKDFDWDCYVHMGFQKPSAFGTVLDLTISEGRVLAVVDRSGGKLGQHGSFHSRYESLDIISKINEAFSLDMDDDDDEPSEYS